MNSVHCSRCVCVHCSKCVCGSTAPGVCALGWVKYREQNFTAGYTLYNCARKNNNNNLKNVYLFFYKTDNYKMLKYRERYR